MGEQITYSLCIPVLIQLRWKLFIALHKTKLVPHDTPQGTDLIYILWDGPMKAPLDCHKKTGVMDIIEKYSPTALTSPYAMISFTFRLKKNCFVYLIRFPSQWTQGNPKLTNPSFTWPHHFTKKGCSGP